MRAAKEEYADRVSRLLASIAEGILLEGMIYDCPWDDFRFMYFRGKDGWTAAYELNAWADSQGIDVDFEERLEGEDLEAVIYVVMR